MSRFELCLCRLKLQLMVLLYRNFCLFWHNLGRSLILLGKKTQVITVTIKLIHNAVMIKSFQFVFWVWRLFVIIFIKLYLTMIHSLLQVGGFSLPVLNKAGLEPILLLWLWAHNEVFSFYFIFTIFSNYFSAIFPVSKNVTLNDVIRHNHKTSLLSIGHILLWWCFGHLKSLSVFISIITRTLLLFLFI